MVVVCFKIFVIANDRCSTFNQQVYYCNLELVQILGCSLLEAKHLYCGVECGWDMALGWALAMVFVLVYFIGWWCMLMCSPLGGWYGLWV